MTPTIPINHRITPEEWIILLRKGYNVKQQSDGLFYLHYPDSRVEPYPFEHEPLAWAVALRSDEFQQECEAYQEYVRTHVVTEKGTFEVEAAK